MGEAITIKARFSRGFIEPLEKLEFEEGKEIILTISDISVFKKKSLVEALRATSGGWKGLVDGEELKKDIYSERLISTRSRSEIKT
jgi:predicted DNA-binding antitoxin AbrB/MazE fold protein